MRSHHLTNFEIQRYYQNGPIFNVCSCDNLPNNIKDGAYVMNLDVYADVGTYWIDLHANVRTKAPSNTVTYFDDFGVEHIPKELKKIINNETSQQIPREQKHKIQQCVNIFALDLLILCLRVKA